jgi:L-rhamnose mutarotase
MARYVFTLELKDQAAVEVYLAHHRAVWPEVTASLRECGVRLMDIYHAGLRLVMIVEMRDGIDYRTAFASHAASSVRVAEWERLMRSLQKPSAEARAGEWWAALEPVFHMEEQEPAVAHLAPRSHTS